MESGVVDIVSEAVHIKVTFFLFLIFVFYFLSLNYNYTFLLTQLQFVHSLGWNISNCGWNGQERMAPKLAKPSCRGMGLIKQF
jgi:hypothetical protein